MGVIKTLSDKNMCQETFRQVNTHRIIIIQLYIYVYTRIK